MHARRVRANIARCARHPCLRSTEHPHAPATRATDRRRKPAALAALKAENKRFRDALNWYSRQAIDDDNRAWNALHPDLPRDLPRECEYTFKLKVPIGNDEFWEDVARQKSVEQRRRIVKKAIMISLAEHGWLDCTMTDCK